MTDRNTTDNRPGLGAQLWGAVKDALIDEDPVTATRRAALQAGKTPAAPAATVAAAGPVAAPAALSPMAATLMAQVLAKATAYTALTDKLGPLEGIVVD